MNATKPRAALLLAKLPRTTYVPARTSVRPAVGAKVVGSFVPRVTQKAFEKYGFSAAALLTDWASIVGKDMAAYTEPERLRWPKMVEAKGAVDPSAAGRPGATLLLRVDGARALDIQYKSQQLIERINAYFGYRAVAEIRIQQGVVNSEKPDAAKRHKLGARASAATATAELAAVDDDKLRAALAVLQAGIAAARR